MRLSVSRTFWTFWMNPRPVKSACAAWKLSGTNSAFPNRDPDISF